MDAGEGDLSQEWGWVLGAGGNRARAGGLQDGLGLGLRFKVSCSPATTDPHSASPSSAQDVITVTLGWELPLCHQPCAEHFKNPTLGWGPAGCQLNTRLTVGLRISSPLNTHCNHGAAQHSASPAHLPPPPSSSPLPPTAVTQPSHSSSTLFQEPQQKGNGAACGMGGRTCTQSAPTSPQLGYEVGVSFQSSASCSFSRASCCFTRLALSDSHLLQRDHVREGSGSAQLHSPRPVPSPGARWGSVGYGVLWGTWWHLAC